MIIKPRRFKCLPCKEVRAISGAIKKTPTCTKCAKAMVEINEMGEVLVVPQDDLVKVHLSPEWNERARKLVLSVFEGE